MDLVVVYLKDVGKHIIVPEKYIHDLNTSQLKNRGKTASRHFLVYCTEDLIECEHYPDPIPDARIVNEFPVESVEPFFLQVRKVLL